MEAMDREMKPNQAAPVDAPIAVLFAFARQGQRATEQQCSASTVLRERSSEMNTIRRMAV
jgi:hypothetical protein